MNHTEPELLQRYLAGEADLTEVSQVEEHLSHCPACSNLLAMIAAEDAALTQTLALDEAELAWVQQIDLTGPVLKEITPWFRQPQTLVLIAALLLASGWMAQNVANLLGGLLPAKGTFGLAADLVRFGPQYLWRLTSYLMNGGLLATLWPALILGAALWLWRHRKKEEQNYA